MIASGAPQEVAPFGRRHLRLHPGPDFFPNVLQHHLAPGVVSQHTLSDKLADALKGTSLQDAQEWWQLRSSDSDGDGTSILDELYVCKGTVVWSRSNGEGTSQVMKTFTLEASLRQALWCATFSTSHKPDIIKDVKDPKEDMDETLEGICILEDSVVHVMTPSGPTFATALPFQVERAWTNRYGLFLLKKPGSFLHEIDEANWCDSESLPLLFNLLHPLDEVTPVVVKRQKLGHFVAPEESICFCSNEPSIMVTYNQKEKIHNLWSVRKTTAEEEEFSVFRAEGSFHQTQNPSLTGSGAKTPGVSWQSPLHHVSKGLFSPLDSPARTSFSRVQTPVRAAHHSPLNHMATLSRCHSPVAGSSGRTAAGGGPRGRFSSPLVNRTLSPNVPGTPNFEESCNAFCTTVPITPDVCMEHFWTEKKPGSFQAKKAFFQSDLSGQNYLCLFIQEQKQLRLIKFDESNNNLRFIVGSVSLISARDVEPVPAMKMLFTVEENYTFALYTGPVKLCKVHIPGALGEFSGSVVQIPWAKNSARTSVGTPRRSSMLPSSSGVRPKFEEEILSPVVSGPEKNSSAIADDISLGMYGHIACLRDGIHNHITLETISGEHYRIVLPEISSSDIVKKLLTSLKGVLPRDVSMQLLTKWYAVRNAPGSSEPSAAAELASFLHCLVGLIGFEQLEEGSKTASLDQEWPFAPVALKKFKNSEQGSEEDWQSVLSSTFHKSAKRESFRLGLDETQVSFDRSFGAMEEEAGLNAHAPLNSYLPTIMYTLHLLYEDCKLSLLQWSVLPVLGKSLSFLSSYLGLVQYRDHYWRDFPDTAYSTDNLNSTGDSFGSSRQLPGFVPSVPPSIFLWLQDFLIGKTLSPFPHLPQITNNIKNIILLYAFLRDGEKPLQWEKYLHRIIAPGRRVQEEFDDLLNKLKSYGSYSHSEKSVLFISDLGYTLEDLDKLPLGVALPLQDVLFRCRQSLPPDWSASAHILTRRRELCALLESCERPSNSYSSTPSNSQVPSTVGVWRKTSTKCEEDGIDQLDSEVLKLRFSQDQRIQEVYRLLQSSRPAKIALQQRPEVSDHEFIEEQERHLYSLCIRTMALPPGRGMLTLRTCCPVITETLPIPKLCLMGVAPPRNTTVDLSHIDVPANMSTWPLFHNGVAAGLRVLPRDSQQIDSSWIVYNKPRSNATTNADAMTEHAGFLMGLGLNGHLAKLTKMSLHDYLGKGHELTSVGVILGLAASMLGSMDVTATKVMSVHLEALLPPTSTELDIPPMVQTASVLGVGLLYCCSVHRHISEVLMGEIGRPPGPEMEHCVDRESYALAAGMALGLVTFGRGAEVAALADLPMADQLYHYMVGGHKRPLVGIHKEKQKSPSYQIREGDSVNVDVTSPGATLALGMMFFNTANRAIAEWMEAPDTQYLLDMVRPDFLLLRTVSHSLILWEEVVPSKAWVEAHLPLIVSAHAFKENQNASHVDYETMSQAYCNIIAGACMSLALKFAGSANDEAFQTLMHYARMFLSLSGKPVSEQAGKSALETCLNVSVLSLAMVMAGTGDLEVLRLCRHLRSRTSQAHSFVQYGSHLATHMALGLLFLGGGRYTLKTTPEAIGAMICAFYPKFPTHSNDNRYHLQAFCHLYALAVEPRLIIPRDIDTGKAVYTHLRIVYKDTAHYSGVDYSVRGPALLPELDLLEEVSVCDPRYWPIVFDRNRNWNTLKRLLEKNGHLYMKQKAGCLPYTQDTKGFRSILSQHLTKVAVCGWDLKPGVISAFSSDPLVLCFLNQFLMPRAKDEQEGVFQQQLCSLLFECAIEEKMEAFPAYIHLLQLHPGYGNACVGCIPEPLQLWQLRLVSTYQQVSFNQSSLLRPDLAQAINKDLHRLLNANIGESISSYITGEPCQPASCLLLVNYLIIHRIPFPNHLQLQLDNANRFQEIFLQLSEAQMPVKVLHKLLGILEKQVT